MNDISRIAKKLPFHGEFGLVEIQSLSPEALDRLNNEQKHELETFTNIRRQKEYVTSRLLLQRLANKLGAHEDEFSVFKDKLGQPFGAIESQKYYISIAHSRKRVFCGITESRAIGVDLEPVDRKVSTKLKRRILHPDEAGLFSEMDTIRMWTMKEAYIKLRGQGLRLNMNQVQVKQKGDEFFIEINNDKRAKICSFQVDNNWLAIAYFSN